MLIKILQDIADNCIKTYNDGVDSENPSDYKKVSSSESSNQYNLISNDIDKICNGIGSWISAFKEGFNEGRAEEKLKAKKKAKKKANLKAKKKANSKSKYPSLDEPVEPFKNVDIFNYEPVELFKSDLPTYGAKYPKNSYVDKNLMSLDTLERILNPNLSVICDSIGKDSKNWTSPTERANEAVASAKGYSISGDNPLFGKYSCPYDSPFEGKLLEKDIATSSMGSLFGTE